jgi:branched-chain amino acid transport system ATP-binding protein
MTLELDAVTAGYGGAGDVLHGVTLDVRTREIVVILGANGAGKTTLMRAISGMIGRRGRIEFEGVDIARRAPDEIVRLGVAQVPQGRGTIVDLTVEENLRAGALVRKDHRGIESDIDRWFGTYRQLADRRRQRAGLLSGGEQQMLAIARAMMSRPRLLLCDEPSLGLSPKLTQELFASLKSISEDTDMAMLIVEQNATIALEIATRGYLLEVGAIAGAGNAVDLKGSDAVRAAYLGY